MGLSSDNVYAYSIKSVLTNKITGSCHSMDSAWNHSSYTAADIRWTPRSDTVPACLSAWISVPILAWIRDDVKIVKVKEAKVYSVCFLLLADSLTDIYLHTLWYDNHCLTYYYVTSLRACLMSRAQFLKLQVSCFRRLHPLDLRIVTTPKRVLSVFDIAKIVCFPYLLAGCILRWKVNSIDRLREKAIVR